jgi:glycosyltransferase involved in cell wall biosynthesis
VPSSKVRVLFINDTARNGGPGRSLYSILKFIDPSVVFRAVLLPREGIINTLLTEGAPGAEADAPNGKISESRGVVDEIVFERHFIENPYEPLHRPIERADFSAPAWRRMGRLAVNIARGTFALGRLARLVRRGQFDLIYCNGTTAAFAGGLLAAITRVPAMWHVRYTSVPPAAKWLHDCLASSREVRRIVCVSKAAAAQFPAMPQKVRVIHNAIDTAEFSRESLSPLLRAELGIGPETIVFGSHGRVLPRKGYPEMIRSAALALSRMTERERSLCRFVVIGDTPADFAIDHLAECRELAAELGVIDKFSFLDFRADVKPYISDFDVGVVPSVYPDPLPRAVLEIMAFGIPVIAFDVGGVAEMLDDSAGALLTLSGRGVEELAGQFLRYLRDPALRRRQGLAARQRVLESFDARIHAKQIQDEIVAAGGRVEEPREIHGG